SAGVAASKTSGDDGAVKAAPLVVGWNDECNNKNIWQAFPPPNTPDVSARHRGMLQLRIGKGAIPDPNPFPYYWASVSRYLEVNLERYPILAVRAVNLKGPSWWDVTVQGSEGGTTLVGKEIKSPSLDHDGIVLFDLQAQAKSGLEMGHQKMRLRLNVAG